MMSSKLMSITRTCFVTHVDNLRQNISEISLQRNCKMLTCFTMNAKMGAKIKCGCLMLVGKYAT